MPEARKSGGSPAAAAELAARKRNRLLGLLLLAATLIAYQPAWHAGFIWDDNDYVTNNPLLTAPDGLQRIWFSLDSPSQYFPLVYTTFRLEHALWGLNPAGFHWVNLLLHAINALLVWRLLKRLRVPGAWLAAAIFALHPVNVESVAWITQLKNVQSLFFSLLTLLAWVEFIKDRTPEHANAPASETGAGRARHSVRADSELAEPGAHGVTRPTLKPGRQWFYLFALAFYALALFSKTTACTLPAALLLVLWLKHKPINWSRLAQVIPFVALGVGMGLVSMWWERHHQGTEGAVYAIGPLERLLIASRAVWFYAGKLIWPANLTFNYPLWKINPADPLAYAGLAAAAGLGAVILYARRFVGRGVEVATLFYVAALSPLLGFIMLYTFRYTFVADHYQYVATLGPIALLAAGISTASWLSENKRPFLKLALSGALLATLGGLTSRQCEMYASRETLWRTTLERNPESFMAHNNLGAEFLQQGRLPEAMEQFQEALVIEPDSPNAHFNLAGLLRQQGRLEEAAAHLQKVLDVQPNDAKAHSDLGAIRLQQGRVDEALVHLQSAVKIQPDFADAHYLLAKGLFQQRRVEDSIAHFQKVAELQPGNAEVHNNLGWALLQNGRLDDAIAQFQTVLKLQPDFAMAHGNLAMALIRKGQAREAVAQFQSLLQLQPDVPPALANLAWVLATWPDASVRNGAQAIELARRASLLTDGQNPVMLRALAAACAESGQFTEAVANARRAIDLAGSQSNAPLGEAIRTDLKFYQAGCPFREPGPTNAPDSVIKDLRGRGASPRRPRPVQGRNRALPRVGMFGRLRRWTRRGHLGEMPLPTDVQPPPPAGPANRND